MDTKKKVALAKARTSAKVKTIRATVDGKNSPLFTSTGLTGKVAKIRAISTNCTLNPDCIKRFLLGIGICAFCYAFIAIKRGTFLIRKAIPHYTKNGDILSNRLLEDWEIPRYTVSTTRYIDCFRFEAFGDLFNITHFENYVNIARKNPDIHFALWTKKWYIVNEYFKTHSRPKNLSIVISSLEIDKPFEPEKHNLSFVPDVVFTVTRDINKVNCKCGFGACANCQRCYHRHFKTIYIWELLRD